MPNSKLNYFVSKGKIRGNACIYIKTLLETATNTHTKSSQKENKRNRKRNQKELREEEKINKYKVRSFCKQKWCFIRSTRFEIKIHVQTQRKYDFPELGFRLHIKHKKKARKAQLFRFCRRACCALEKERFNRANGGGSTCFLCVLMYCILCLL